MPLDLQVQNLKIKLYIYSIGKDEKESVEKLDLIERACREKWIA